MNCNNSRAEIGDIGGVPIVRLISFAGGDPNLDGPVKRFEAQAAEFDAIDECVVLREKDLDEVYWDTFSNRHSYEGEKGFRFMSWKPYLVSQELEKMRDGDLLIYCDVGVELNAAGQQRLQDYFDIAALHGQLFFKLSNGNRFWTKKDPKLLPADRHFFRSQIISGIFIALVCEETKKLFGQWLELASFENGSLLSEESSFGVKNNSHRHDQSVLSRVVYEFGSKGIILDETYFQPWVLGKRMPFLALRNKYGTESWLPMEFKSEPWRKISWLWFFLTHPNQLLQKLRTLSGRL